MPKLTITEAARIAGVGRTTIHRAIRAGRLHPDPQRRLDTTDLLCAGFTLQDTPGAAEEGPAAPQAQQWLLLHHERAALYRERDLLATQLTAALEREQAARARETLLLQMLHAAQQEVQRLRALSPPSGHPAGAAPAAPATVPLAFDPARYVLGKLCPRRHAFQETGQSLRRLKGYVCLQCDAEKARERRQAQRQECQASLHHRTAEE
jgi:hypothetical protein